MSPLTFDDFIERWKKDIFETNPAKEEEIIKISREYIKNFMSMDPKEFGAWKDKTMREISANGGNTAAIPTSGFPIPPQTNKDWSFFEKHFKTPEAYKEWLDGLTRWQSMEPKPSDRYHIGIDEVVGATPKTGIIELISIQRKEIIELAGLITELRNKLSPLAIDRTEEQPGEITTDLKNNISSLKNEILANNYGLDELISNIAAITRNLDL